MKIMMLAGLMITLPAIIVGFFFFGRVMMFPAIASLAINLLPFFIGGLLLKGGSDDVGH